MSRKGFMVKVELEIQKVTCPGVWLCSNGKVSLQIQMLDSSIQTRNSKPAFPISCYEKYVFSKIFYNDRRLNDLQRSLNNEWFYSELIQWKSREEGCVLATFQTTLDDLLYPSSFRGTITGVDIDLLMEPTKLFPGTIAPKLEVSTKTTVEEILCEPNSDISSTVFVNPKALVSAQSPHQTGRTRKVCHTVAFSRAQKKLPNKGMKNKPPFIYRRVSDDLIMRKNPNVVLKHDEFQKNNSWKPSKKHSAVYCYCKSNSLDICPKMMGDGFPEKMQIRNAAKCQEKAHKDVCSVCSTYEGYFSANNSKMNTLLANKYRPQKLCSYCKQNVTKKCHVSRDGSPCPSDLSESSRRKVCFCLPAEETSSLAKQLHDKFSKTLETNSRLFHNCIDWGEDSA